MTRGEERAWRTSLTSPTEGYVARLVQVGVWATPQNPIQYAFLEQDPLYLPNEPGWAVLSRRAAGGGPAGHRDDRRGREPDLRPGSRQPAAAGAEQSAHQLLREQRRAQLIPAAWTPTSSRGSDAIHGADIRFNTARIAQRQSNEGWQDFTSFVALHEVLHAMGLSHPGNYNGQGFNYQDHAEFVEDTIQYSVMSYFAAAHTGADHIIGSVQYGGRTPLLYDILALQ